jgi:hypothetical protein
MSKFTQNGITLMFSAQYVFLLSAAIQAESVGVNRKLRIPAYSPPPWLSRIIRA